MLLPIGFIYSPPREPERLFRIVFPRNAKMRLSSIVQEAVGTGNTDLRGSVDRAIISLPSKPSGRNTKLTRSDTLEEEDNCN